MKNMRVKDLEYILQDKEGNLPVMVYCSYNQFTIARLRVMTDRLVIDVGEALNPANERTGDLDFDFDDDDWLA